MRNRLFFKRIFADICGSYPHMRPILNAYPHIRGNSIRALAYILSIILWPISLYWQGAKIIIYIYWYIYPSLLDILLILFYIYFSTVRLFVSVCSSVLTFFEFVFGPFGWTLSSLDSHISLYLSKYICIYIHIIYLSICYYVHIFIYQLPIFLYYYYIYLFISMYFSIYRYVQCT